MGLDEHLGDEHALQGTSSGMIANDAWAFQGEVRWSHEKHEIPQESMRYSSHDVSRCTKMYQNADGG